MVSFRVPPSTIFQSTLSVRRATVLERVGHEFVVISIHALRKESDPELPDAETLERLF